MRKRIYLCLLFILCLFSCKPKEKHVHDFSEPTCESKATCRTCFETINEPLGHDYSYTVVEEPTYTTEGSMIGKCSRCNKEIIEFIPKVDTAILFEETIAQINIDEITTKNLTFPSKIGEVSITWLSSRPTIISHDGVISRGKKDQTVSIIAKLKAYDEEISHRFNVVVCGYSTLEKLNMAMETISFPNLIETDLNLNYLFDYDVTVKYESTDQNLLTNDGKVNLLDLETKVDLKVILEVDGEKMEKTFKLNLGKRNNEMFHQLIYRVNDFDVSSNENLTVNDEKIVLKEGSLTGTYTSEEISSRNFSSLVGSFAAKTSKNATVELKIRAFVNNTWSDYITYSPWGLGLQNASHDQTYSLIKLLDDEVMITNNRLASKVQFQVVLKRDNLSSESPKLSLVSLALDIPSYSYSVDLSTIKDSVIYNVPKLCQRVVPQIGNSICSATSTTMLLKYKEMNFTQYDSEYEHRYIASIVKDYGNNIYGNWSYNTIAMGGYGFDAYVARMYSIEELMWYLSNVGPVALSVKGTMKSNLKTYTTSGHLLVATGYKYNNGNLVFLCNDPNVDEVTCEYTESVIKQTWRNVCYIIE